MPPVNPKSKQQRSPTARQTAFRPEWIAWGFWGICGCTLGAMVIAGMPGAIIPALGTGLAFALTRAGVTERLRPYHPAYCVGTAMTIWLLWTMLASGNPDFVIDLGVLLLGLGLVSAWPGAISASVLSAIMIARAVMVWSLRGESTPVERDVITVEVTMLLLTVVATWAGFGEGLLRQTRNRKRKKTRPTTNCSDLVEDELPE